MIRSFLPSLLAIAALVAAVPTASAQSGSSHWKFEETSGDPVLDSTGGNQGTLVNGVSRLTAGRIGRALRFDGQNDYGTLGNSNSLKSTTFSVSLWVRRNGAQGDWAKILTKGDPVNAPWASYKFEFHNSSDTVVNWHVGFTDGTRAATQNVTPLGDAQWIHLAGTYDGTALRLYVNGVLESTSPVSGKTVRFDNVPLTVGGYSGWGYFRGDLDEVRYFSRALSGGEVQTISGGAPAPAPTLTHLTFQPTSAAFPNPERGFTTWSDFRYPNYAHVRADGNTLTRPYFMLDSYRNGPLPQSFLNQLTAEFQKARQAGVKVIPRFAYNFGPYPNSQPDASEARIKSHLQQLKPILAANVDVISSMEAGFIGAWGEWHTSTNGLDTNRNAKASILNALLAALPASRMVALRYPTDMQQLNGAPITFGESFSGTNRARVGSHQDCFLASPDDWGTWGRTGNSHTYDKNYVADNGRYAVVGGETCNPNPPRSQCATALSELSSMHWSYLSEDWEPTVIQGFVNGGCFDEIDRRLGYRFTLLSGSHSQSVQRGQNFQFNLRIANEGFAAMFNRRPIFAVFYNGSGNYACQLQTDPRRWEPGVVTDINETCVLPANMTPGSYNWALWLPDDAASLRNNPLYAVRFANQSVWDAARGYNVMGSSVTVTP